MNKVICQRSRYVAADFITANIAVLVFDIARYYVLRPETVGFPTLRHFLLSDILLAEQIVLPFIVLGVYTLSGFYNRPFHKSQIQTMFSTLGASIFNTLLIYFALLVNSRTSIRMTSYELLFYLFASLSLFGFLGRALVTYSTIRRIRKGKLRFNIAVAGDNPSGRETAEGLRQNCQYNGYRFTGFIALPGEKASEGVCTIEDAEKFCKEHSVEEVIVAPGRGDEKYVSELLGPLFRLQLPLKIQAEALPSLTASIKLQSIYEEPYIDLTSANVTESTRNVKRLIDIVASSAALCLLAIPMAAIGVAVKLDSKGSALFRQERIGYHGRPFNILKFRTMVSEAEKDGPRLSSENDSRITRLGRYLRKYRLDELPQFWNVLTGDMSLVGPRPERRHFIEQIMAVAPQYTLVHQVRPGITSWGMVKYGYASSVEQMIERLRYDLVYLANISIAVDIKILIYTVKTVIKGRGK